MNEFVDSLKEYMNDYNLNNLQLSKLLGISSTAVNGYFNYGYLPNIQTAIKMCDIFDCSLDYLFGLSDTSKREYKITIDNALNNFNSNIENLIKDNKLTISGTMRDLTLDEYTYYHWKHGKMPKTINVISIAKYFGVSIDYLFGFDKNIIHKH